MKIKKRIQNHFNFIPIPTADKVLPEAALVDRRTKTSTRLVLKLSTVIVCVCAIAVSLIVGLNRPPQTIPIIDVSETVSLGVENSNTNESESKRTDESDDCTSIEPNTSNEPNASQDPDASEPDVSDVSGTVPSDPSEILNIYITPEAGEFAGDMYRPDGYHKNIGSALALMMHYTPESDARFNVLLYVRNGDDLEAIILKINEKLFEDIPLEQMRAVEVEGDILVEQKKYHLYLSAEQINALAENRVSCRYIGSGIGEYKDMNWETVEGIKTYCELNGDMFTFNKRGILADTDIIPEQ